MQKSIEQNRPTRGLTRLGKREEEGLQSVVCMILEIYIYIYIHTDTLSGKD